MLAWWLSCEGAAAAQTSWFAGEVIIALFAV
jgi:hypothetical protein